MVVTYFGFKYAFSNSYLEQFICETVHDLKIYLYYIRRKLVSFLQQLTRVITIIIYLVVINIST